MFGLINIRAINFNFVKILIDISFIINNSLIYTINTSLCLWCDHKEDCKKNKDYFFM